MGNSVIQKSHAFSMAFALKFRKKHPFILLIREVTHPRLCDRTISRELWQALSCFSCPGFNKLPTRELETPLIEQHIGAFWSLVTTFYVYIFFITYTIYIYIYIYTYTLIWALKNQPSIKGASFLHWTAPWTFPMLTEGIPWEMYLGFTENRHGSRF